MRAYLIASAFVFALVLLAHIARIAIEGAGTLGDPFFAGSTLIAAAMTGWALALVLAPARRR